MLIPDSNCRLITFSSPLGWMALAIRDGKICDLTFGQRTLAAAVRALNASDGEVVEPNRRESSWVRRLRDFAAGTRDDLRDLPIAVGHLTEFQQRVVEQCRRVGFGETVSYAELAARAGSPGAARAVGNVMARNRLPLIVPCHRVVGTAGALGGYSAPDGLQMKRRLLELEGVTRVPCARPKPPLASGRLRRPSAGCAARVP